MTNVQILGAEGALNGDREAITRAIYLDPATSAKLSLDEMRAMTDEMFSALQSEIDNSFFN